MITSNEVYDVKTIEQRVLEIILSSSSSYAINKYVLKNMRDLPLIQYIGIFVGSSIGAEYVTEYICLNNHFLICHNKNINKIIYIVN